MIENRGCPVTSWGPGARFVAVSGPALHKTQPSSAEASLAPQVCTFRASGAMSQHSDLPAHAQIASGATSASAAWIQPTVDAFDATLGPMIAREAMNEHSTGNARRGRHGHKGVTRDA
jgi:hypothetical protein